MNWETKKVTPNPAVSVERQPRGMVPGRQMLSPPPALGAVKRQQPQSYNSLLQELLITKL